MSFLESPSVLSILWVTTLCIAPSTTRAARFDIQNNCPFTVWAAAVPGGGKQLKRGESWTLNVNKGTTGGRIWARTACTFNASGHGTCQTGDCGGLLQCQAYGQPPNTLAEYGLNQFNNLDFIDISSSTGSMSPWTLAPRLRATGGSSVRLISTGSAQKN
ncbi:hypothetical protein M0R45_000536 [Rubus argutus]|uniref:Uncharacterized protein n=1 Tax=Rubus argutus TaxID=59490 RepID=A0AAW1VPS2_RUBAR